MKNVKPRNRDDVSTKARFSKKVKGEAKKKNLKPVPEPFNGIPVDSFAERYTLMWLFELEKAGFIKEINRSSSYLLFNTVSKNWIRRLKTKSVPEVETILASHLYTPDFVFKVTDKGKMLPLFTNIKSEEKLRERNRFNLICQDFVDSSGNAYTSCHIETKGTSFRHKNNTTEKFIIDQKWTWEKHGVYVNLFVPNKVFSVTFTPERYLLTDKSLEPRKIGWKIRKFWDYIHQK